METLILEYMGNYKIISIFFGTLVICYSVTYYSPASAVDEEDEDVNSFPNEPVIFVA